MIPAAALVASLAIAAPAFAQESEPAVPEKAATAVAERQPEVHEARREHHGLEPSATVNDQGNWEIGFYADDEEPVLVIVGGSSGDVLETWTGYQVAWKMARGYPGAFGHRLNAPYVWIPLCLMFVAGLFDWRRPRRIAHLDLLVIVGGFGISHFFFNRADIGVSVPLAYPALLYLMARMLWIGFRGGGEGSRLRPSLPVTWLIVAALFLVGFRLGLDVADSNVIDVGYSGVIGADKVMDGEPIYGDFPEDDHAGDTYGPVAYYSYIPFEQLLPWSGSWGDLPAAHAAAIFFDLATMAGLFVFGRRFRPGSEGTGLGAALIFAWAACPYTAFALESNTNDPLVSALLIGVLLLLSSPPGRGALLAAASLTKFAPIVLAPLFATYVDKPYGSRSLRVWLNDHWKAVALFTAALIATLAIGMAQTIVDPGLATFWDHTISFQVDRDSPFSIWGQDHSLEWLQTAIKVAVGALALLAAFLPRRRDAVTVAALGAALLIGVELTVQHWFYLYIPWFLPFLFVALLARGASATAASSSSGPAPEPGR